MLTLHERLIRHIEAAAQLPLVSSGPLIRLGNFLAGTPEIAAASEDDDELLDLLEAAKTLAAAWSFWPPDQYGSSTALIDVGAVQEAIDTVQRCRAYLSERGQI